MPLLVAHVLGATHATDTFFIAFALVSFVLNALSGATQNALVPVLVHLKPIPARGLIALLETLSSAVTLGLAAILAAVNVPAGAGWFVLALTPFAVAASLASTWTGALYAERVYRVAAMTPALRGLGVIAVVWWFGAALGVRSLLIGYSIGELLRLAVLARYVKPPMPSWCVSDALQGEIRGFLKIGGSQALGSALIASMPVVDRFAAASLATGSVSLLDYAERVCQVPIGLLMSGFLVVSLAQWSHDAAQGESIDILRTKARWNATILVAVSVIPVALLIIFRGFVARLLFGYAPITPAELQVLANTLGAYLLGVPVMLAGLTYTRAFLVVGRSDWLLKVSVGQLAVKILLNIALTKALGLPGIAIATSIVYNLGSLAHAWRFHRLRASEIALVHDT